MDVSGVCMECAVCVYACSAFKEKWRVDKSPPGPR